MVVAATVLELVIALAAVVAPWETATAARVLGSPGLLPIRGCH